ncbi:MAG: RsmE family RNA methyltransferase [Victivallaceae bacterium]|jgi:16S rRNA (uracil1498-N3)-methyltransferase
MHCFYCEKINLPGSAAELDERDWKHLFKTLRAVPGEKIMLMDGRGVTADAVIADGREIIVERCERTPEPEVKLHLYLVVPKKQKMDQLLKQCAEIGVWSITPMTSARSVVLASGESAAERWESLLLEGCKQSHNPFIPQVGEVTKLGDAVKTVAAQPVISFFGAPDARIASDKIEKSGNEIAWFVGPEGGFTQEEEALMLEYGFNKLCIGNWVMRVETAAVCGAAILLFEKQKVT